MMRKQFLAVFGLAILALAGCAPDGAKSAGNTSDQAAARPAPAPAPATAQEPELAWTSKVTGVGIGLILAPPGGDPVFSLACVRGSREIRAVVENVKPISSEDRLTLGFDDLIVAFAVKPEALKEGRIIEAGTKIQPELLEAIRTTKQIRGSYGATQIGPYPAPPQELVAPFVSRCGPLV